MLISLGYGATGNRTGILHATMKKSFLRDLLRCVTGISDRSEMYMNICKGYYVKVLLEPNPALRIQQVTVNSGIFLGMEKRLKKTHPS